MQGSLGDVPVVVAVNDAGRVAIYTSESPHLPPLCLSSDVETWSCSTSSAVGSLLSLSHPTSWSHALLQQFGEDHRPILACGANSRLAKVKHVEFLSPSQSPPKPVQYPHGHNIPAVALSPCGNYLATVSIDRAVRIWDAHKSRLLYAAFHPREW